MALQSGDETRRQVADLDHEDYGVLPDDDQERTLPAGGDVMPPPEVHHERHDPFEGHTGLAFPQAIPPGNEPRKAPSGHDKLDFKPEETMKSPAVADGFEGESMVKELEDKSGFQGFDVPDKEESRGFPSEGPPPPVEEHAGKEAQGGSAAGGGIIDVHNLKDDYVDLSESRDALPSADASSKDEGSDLVPEEKQTPEDFEGPGGQRGGIIDVNSLKDDYIDLSEPKSPPPDEVVHEPEESSLVAPEEKPEGQSTEGGGIIDVHNLKDDYTDLSRSQPEPGSDVYSTPPSGSPTGAPGQEEALELPSPVIDRDQSQASEDKRHEDTAQFTSHIKSPADEPKQEEAAEIHEPIVDHGQLPQEEEDDSKREIEGLQHDGNSFSVKQEENAQLSSLIDPPNELEEERTGDSISRDFNKPESGGFHPDAVPDIQEAEEENIGVHGAEEIDRPESKVPDPTYVLGGRPECGIVVPENSERNAQEEHVESTGESGVRDAPKEFLDVGTQDYKPDARDTDVVQEEGPPQDEMKEADEEKENVSLREMPVDMALAGAGISEGVDAEKREETSRAISFDKVSGGPLFDDQSEGAEERRDVTTPLDESKRDITSFDEQAKELAHGPPPAEDKADVDDPVEKTEETEKVDVDNVEGTDLGQVIDDKSGVEPQIADYSTTHVPEEENKEVEGDSGDRDQKSDLGLPVLDDGSAHPPEEAVTTDKNIAVVPGKDGAKEHIKFDAEEPDVAPAVPAEALAVGVKSDEQTTVQGVPQAEDALNLEHSVVDYDTRDLGEQENREVKGSPRKEEEHPLLEEPILDNTTISLPEEQEAEAPSSYSDTPYAPEETSGKEKMEFGAGEDDVSRGIPAETFTAGLKGDEETAVQKDHQPDQALDFEQGDVQAPDMRKSEGAEEVVPQAADVSGIAEGIEGVAVPLASDTGDGTHLDERSEGVDERREAAAPVDEYSKPVPADSGDEKVIDGSLIDGHSEEAEKIGEVPGPLDEDGSHVTGSLPPPQVEKKGDWEDEGEKAEETREGDEQKNVARGIDEGQSAVGEPEAVYTTGWPEERHAEVQDGGTESEVAHPLSDSIARPPDTEFNVPPQDDDVKGGLGGEEPVPNLKENRDLELTEAMEQEEERKQTDDHPLIKPPQKEGADEGEAPLHVEGGDGGDLQDGLAISGHGKEGEDEDGGRPGGDVQPSVAYERPDVAPHPQPEDLNIKTRDSTTATTQPPLDDQHEPEHHKKGVFERIKDKLTPPYHVHSH